MIHTTGRVSLPGCHHCDHSGRFLQEDLLLRCPQQDGKLESPPKNTSFTGSRARFVWEKIQRIQSASKILAEAWPCRLLSSCCCVSRTFEVPCASATTLGVVWTDWRSVLPAVFSSPSISGRKQAKCLDWELDRGCYDVECWVRAAIIHGIHV